MDKRTGGEMIHQLKTLPEYYHAINTGRKTFEVRKNDRDFQIGDILILKEYDKGYTGNEIKVKLIYILYGGQFGIDKDYCVMGIKKLEAR
jgi:ASC-1-like (ASCH) protein